MLDIHTFELFLNDLRYEHPLAIWWAIPAGAATVALWYFWWKTKRAAISGYGDKILVTRYTKPISAWLAGLLLCGLLSVVVLGFAAATMPFKPLAPVTVDAGTLRVVAVYDSSRSMGAEDDRGDQQIFGGPSCMMEKGPCGRRIDIGKWILINQVMPLIKGNRIGIVTYSGGPVTRSFLNDDFKPLVQILTTWKWVDLNGALGEGSYIDMGLHQAVQVLKDDQLKPGKSKPQDIILLFTDGGNDSKEADLAKAEEEVHAQGAKVIVVLLGATSQSAIPLYDEDDQPIFEKDGARSYFKDKAEDGQIVYTAADEKGASQLAGELGGMVVRAQPGRPLNINWPAALMGQKAQINKRYYYQYPLAPALVILSVIWLAPVWQQLLSYIKRKFAGAGR
ncbi:MAG TPA: vWA domain-containing protein [Planktothrix sp.]|jgi:hypothetical protein